MVKHRRKSRKSLPPAQVANTAQLKNPVTLPGGRKRDCKLKRKSRR